MSLASLSGAPPPGRRAGGADSGGPPLSSLSGAPSLSGNKARGGGFNFDDDDLGGLGPSSLSRASSTARSTASASTAKSNVRKSTPNPLTSKLDDDEDLFPKSTKKSVSFAPDRKGKGSLSKSPFGDSDDDDMPRAGASRSMDPFGDDNKPSSSFGRTGSGAASKSSSSNPAFKFDDDSPPKRSKGLFDDDDNDFLSALNPDAVFSGSKKKDDDSLGSRTPTGGAGGRGTRPTGPKADDIFGMLKDEPPPPPVDLGLDLFGATASKPAAGARAGRRAAGGASETSPEPSRDPTPEPQRPTHAAQDAPSIAGRVPPGVAGAMGRSMSAPRDVSGMQDDFSGAPARSADSGTAMGGRRRTVETGPSLTTIVGEEGDREPPAPPARGGRGPGGMGSGDGGGRGAAGGVDLDGDDLPGLGSPALTSKNASTSSFSPSAGGPMAGRRATAAPVMAKSASMRSQHDDEDEWGADDDLLPDDSHSAPAPAPTAAPAASPPLASSGYTPSAELHGRSRLSQATFGGPKKEDPPADDDEPSMGGYMPSFGSRRPPSGTGMIGGLGGVGASMDMQTGPLGGSALTPGGPGAPRPRRQIGGSAEASPMASYSGASTPAGRPGALPGKKTKEEEEKERVAAAMAAAMARRQQVLGSGPIRFPGMPSGPIPSPAASSVVGSDRAGGMGASEGLSVVVSSPASASPVRGRPGAMGAGAGGPMQRTGFGKTVADLGLSADSSDDDLPMPAKATSPAVPTPSARKPSGPATGSAPDPIRAANQQQQHQQHFEQQARPQLQQPQTSSSVPDMGRGEGLGQIGSSPTLQSGVTSPQMQPEPSYPLSAQHSGHSAMGAVAQTPIQERSAASVASGPSGGSMQQLMGGVPGVPGGGMQQGGLPPGVTALGGVQGGLPPGVTAMGGQERGLPPGVTAMGPGVYQQQQSLPPGVQVMGMQQQQQQQQLQVLPPGVTVMGGQQQAGLPPGVTAMGGQSAGLPPGVTRLSGSGTRQDSAFAVGPSSHTASALSPALPPHTLGGHGAPGSMSPSLGSLPQAASSVATVGSPADITLTPHIPMDSIKESLVKSLQEELEKVTKQVSEVKATYDKQLDDLRAANTKQLEDTRAHYEKQLDELRSQSERHVTDTRSLQGRALEDARAEHEKQLAEVRSQAEAQGADLRAQHERHVADMRAAYEKQLSDLRSQQVALMEDARSRQTKAVEDQRIQHQKSLDELRMQNDKVLADARSLHAKQILDLKAAHETELRRAAEDVRRAVEDTRRTADEVRRQENETRRSKEESAALRDRILALEGELRARDQVIREGESRLVQLDSRAKTELAEVQAAAIKEAALLKLELEDAKAGLQRVRQQYDEAANTHAQELARYRAELEATRVMANEEMQRARLTAAEQIAAAEARGRRAGMLDKEIAEATIKQQLAAIAEEKETVSRHRLSAELLAQLTDKVRSVAVSSIEREERALSALERDVADREGRLAAREKLLAEREGRVAAREKEVDELRANLQNLMVTLESSAVHDREDLKREQLRLSREAARVEAATSSLQAERDDLRVQIAMERRLLEEAREARRKEREELLSEVTAERRRLAAEYSDTQRQLDAARGEVLALRSRLVDLESRCSTASTQAAQEERRLEVVRSELAAARAALETEVGDTRRALQQEVSAARQAVDVEVVAQRRAFEAETSHRRAELQRTKEAVMDEKAHVDVEARQLVEYAARLQAQSQELAAQAAEAESRHQQLAAALEGLAADQAELREAQAQLEEQKRTLADIKKALDRERLGMAEERRALSEERLAASRAADEARVGQLRLAEAVRAYVQQGVPIPFVMDGAAGALKPLPPGPPLPLPTVTPDKQQSGKRRGNRDGRTGAGGGGGRSRNALKHMLDKLGIDPAAAVPGGGAGGEGYLRAQQDFLQQMRLSAPAGVQGPLSPGTAPRPAANRPHAHAGPTSPVPPGLDPALVPPGLQAYARSAAATPVKLDVGPGAHGPLFERERPPPMSLPGTDGWTAGSGMGSVNQPGAGVGTAAGAGQQQQGVLSAASGGGATAHMHIHMSPTQDLQGAGGSPLPPGSAIPGGAGIGAIQQLLNTIQSALDRSSAVQVHTHTAAGPAAGNPQLPGSGGVMPGPTPAARTPNPTRDLTNDLELAASGARADRDGAPIGLTSTRQMGSRAGAGPVAVAPLQTPLAGEAQGVPVSSDLASLAPLSSSTSSLGALEADPTDPLGISGLGLGPAPVLAARLDALAGELSAASAVPGTTPRGTTHGGRAAGTPGIRPELSERQQQLGELAQISSALATQLGLEIEGLGLAGRAAAGGMASVGSSSLYSPAGGPGAGGLGVFGTVAAMERAGSLGRQQSSQLSPSMPLAPSMRVWAQAGSTSHGSGSTVAGARPGQGTAGGGGSGVAMRSTEASALLGSANAEALAGVTLPVQVIGMGRPIASSAGAADSAHGDYDAAAGGTGEQGASPAPDVEGGLSPIASVHSISDSDDDGM